MKDERIVAYLRSRAHASPPLDLVGSIVQETAGLPQSPGSWIARFLPAAAAVAVAATVLAVVMVTQQRADPSVSESPTASGSTAASASASASPAATPGPTALLQVGDAVAIDAVDARGRWGVIVVTRGEEIGGFPHAPVPDGAFVLTIAVEYRYDRVPEGEFGRPDWSLETADGQPVGGIFEPSRPDDPSIPIEGLSIGSLPGATVMEPSMGGPVVFEVPRSAADEELVLVYRPDGFEERISSIPIRDPSEPPPPVAMASPAPTPRPLTYVDRGGPFSVIDNAEADALFATPDTCANPEAGYTVVFPDDWYTNTATGDMPACSWFSPTSFDVDGPGVPGEIVVTIGSFEGGIGFVHQPVYSVQDDIEVAGWTANRTEELGGFGAEGDLPRSLHTYQYVVYADEDDLGLKVVASTSNEMPGDYEMNKAVLDRIMASMEFDR